jgi:hypothetical protein
MTPFFFVTMVSCQWPKVGAMKASCFKLIVHLGQELIVKTYE